ncbi:hypothetical protein CLF_106315 [Clonorchis sinensis]|uniref:Uncharacterized protein n=1 Tax=Clonorchis sinensis TaxID=79923 RepID=G7YPW5_CLOSI|nr:hypothetical protein CLF_106315 [Clonorchis sinensis]
MTWLNIKGPHHDKCDPEENFNTVFRPQLQGIRTCGIHEALRFVERRNGVDEAFKEISEMLYSCNKAYRLILWDMSAELNIQTEISNGANFIRLESNGSMEEDT